MSARPPLKNARRADRKAKRATADVPAYDSLPEMVMPEEAAAYLRVSRNGIYDLLRSGALPSIRFGRLIRIRKAALIGERQ